MTKMQFEMVSRARGGIRQQENLTRALGLAYAKHDDVRYNAGSDIELSNRHISVKSRHFTLMASCLCEGETTLEGIWNVYARNTASNEWAYVIEDTAYFMNKNEFKEFIFSFTDVEKDSVKGGGGGYKIRGKRCENKMKAWFEARV